MVILESPERLATTLADLADALGGDRRGGVARELSKLHEEFRRGTLDEVVAWAAEPPKGEMVLVVDGAPEPGEADDDRVRAVLAELRTGGASTRDASDEVARRLGVSRRRAYRLALE